MNNQPILSILINNYNYGKFLRRAIDSALNQTYQKIEVIVVDDGSTDNSHEIIASYDSRITAVLKDNSGQPSAINAGFKVSQGDIIALLDSDDWFEPHKAEEIVKIFVENPDISWCFHTLKLVKHSSGKAIMALRAFPQLDEDISQKCDFRERLMKGRLGFYAPSTSGLCFTHSTLENIFPLPEILGNAVDRYLAYAAMSMAKGYYLNSELGVQLIHEQNHITLQENDVASRRRTRHAIVNAYYLRSRFPKLRWFSHRVFSRGLSMSWQYGLESTDGQIFLEKYLSSVSFFEKVFIGLVALYQQRPWKIQKTYIRRSEICADR